MKLSLGFRHYNRSFTASPFSSGCLLPDEAPNLALEELASLPLPSSFNPTFLPFTLCPRPISPYWKPCEGLPKVISQTGFLVSPSFFDPGSWLYIPPQFSLFFFLVLYLTGLTDYKLLLSDTAWHWSVMVAHWCWRGAVVVLWGAQWLGDSAFHWGYRGEPLITSKHRFQMGEWGFTVNSVCFPW